jgi:outer membrane protein OmpA-like peptidoglycan-associated protein
MRRIYSNYNLLKTGFSVIILALLLTMGCAGIPERERNTVLERARVIYSQAQSDPKITANAPVAMYEAGQALQKAEQAKNIEEMKHLAYMAERQTQLAVAVAEKKIAETDMELLSREREKILLEAREREIEQAKSKAEAKALELEKARKEIEAKAIEIERAKSEAETLARQADIARKEAEAKTIEIERAKSEAEAKALEIEKARKETESKALEAEQAKKEAEARALELEKARKESEARAQEAEKARLQAEEAIAKKKQLESELAEMKATKTERGIILTLGDILFESGKAVLMPGATDTIDKLVKFLEEYPNRDVLIEGHTDNVGGETYNLGLSQRRANAVKNLLTSKGISESRITAKGYGESRPIASNKTAAGRQQNRRVEIVILDEGVSNK